jgi:hypothetical protein
VAIEISRMQVVPRPNNGEDPRMGSSPPGLIAEG